MILLTELKEKGLIPEGLPVHCECGSPLVANNSLTEIRCSNEFCPLHEGNKLVKLLRLLNIKANIGEQRAINIMIKLKFIAPAEIFRDENLEKLRFMGEKAYIDLAYEISQFKKKPMKFATFIDALQLETLGSTRANLIFSNVKTPQEFYEFRHTLSDIEFRRFISDKIKVSWSSDTVREIVRELDEAEEYITALAEPLTFQEVKDETMYICITGAVNKLLTDDGKPITPRERLAEVLSQRSNINIVAVNNLSERHVSYLVMDTDMTTNRKYKKAVSTGIPVVTSKELEDILMKREA